MRRCCCAGYRRGGYCGGNRPAGPTAPTPASRVSGPNAAYPMGDLQSNLEVSKFFSSSIDLLIGTSGSGGVADSSEFRGKAIFLPVLPGGSATAASDEDFNRPTVFFSSSIDFLIGFFRACLFFFLTTSSSEDDDV